MKKALGVVAALALVVWVISWFRAPADVAKSAAREWPGGMGTIETVADRLPPVQANDASRKLTALAKALPKNDALDEYVFSEMTRDELTIKEPPAIPDVAPIRDMLLREPIVLPRRNEEIGDADTTTRRAVLLTAARTLVASALKKARANDPDAWEDLHAVWKLARSLDGRPQMMIQTASMSMGRFINAVAWKMPLPAPAWLREVHEHDNVPALLEAFQHQTASYWQDGAQLFPTKMLATSVETDRLIAVDVYNATACDVNTRENELGTDLKSVWRRALRYRAEREATVNALRVREGKPIETKSRCSDGAWTYDGTTLRFSREIPTAAPDRPMPLTLKVKP
ncbi:MAG TPA: hypothetical protein VF787_17480 [Thermoanaerobaculia bacterium]